MLDDDGPFNLQNNFGNGLSVTNLKLFSVDTPLHLAFNMEP